MASRDDGQQLRHALAEEFALLSVKNEILSIPIFYGNSSERSVREWLEECHLYASLYKWKEENYKYIFGLRLQAEAKDFHANRMKYYPNEPYSAWRHHFIKYFETSMDLDKLKVKFSNLKQKPNQPIQQFIRDLVRIYVSIYGTTPATIQSTTEPERASNRGDILLKVFFNGIQGEIRNLLVNSNLLLEFNWATVTDAALKAERILIAHKLANMTPTNSINTISTEFREQICAQMERMEELEKKFNMMTAQKDEKDKGPQEETTNGEKKK